MVCTLQIGRQGRRESGCGACSFWVKVKVKVKGAGEGAVLIEEGVGISRGSCSLPSVLLFCSLRKDLSLLKTR